MTDEQIKMLIRLTGDEARMLLEGGRDFTVSRYPGSDGGIGSGIWCAAATELFAVSLF